MEKRSIGYFFRLSRILRPSAFANSPVLHLVHLPASLKDIPASAFESSPWVVILCPAGSAAQAFAQANGIYYVTGQ